MSILVAMFVARMLSRRGVSVPALPSLADIGRDAVPAVALVSLCLIAVLVCSVAGLR